MVPSKKYTLLNSGPFKDTKVSMMQGHKSILGLYFLFFFYFQKNLKISKYDLYGHTQMFRFVFLLNGPY